MVFVAFAAFAAVYAIASVIFFGIFGGFLTYPLLSLFGIGASEFHLHKVRHSKPKPRRLEIVVGHESVNRDHYYVSITAGLRRLNRLVLACPR